MKVHVLVACVALASGVLVRAQEPTFKGGIRTVGVYATVKGADGRLVPDLGRDAFTILDNGKPRELSLFANDIQPITVVMLLDRSGSMRAKFGLVEKAAEEFVRELGPGDKARIGSFSNRIEIDPRDFTSDKEEMLGILRNDLQEEGPTPLWNAVNVGITALLHQKGRRVVLVFTDGVDRPGNMSNNNNTLKDVMKRAEEEDVMVYAIGLAGENGMGGYGHRAPGAGGHGGGRGGFPPGGMGGRGGYGGRGGWPGGMGGGGRGGYGRPQAPDDKPDEGLQKIAAVTGGGYFELTSTDDLGSTFARVADELHHQYALGFSPAVLDGKMHNLEVKVGNASLTVRARKSYLARPEPVTTTAQ